MSGTSDLTDSNVQNTNHNSSYRLIQITDCHLGPRPGEQLLGLDTDESYLDVLHTLKHQESAADLLVASGDIASDGHLEAYERFLQMTRAAVSCPIAWLAGNHDLDTVMRQFPASQVQRDYIELDHWQIILLDSSVPGHEHGDITQSEILRLQEVLSRCQKHALVFVHHQPVPIGCDWIDGYVIKNAPQLLDILSQFPQVKGLVWGHVHQEFVSSHQHFALYSSPSTCIQFKPNSQDFALDELMPGYRWFDLHPDGQMNTGVERIPAKAYGIDFASAGY